MSKKQTLDDVRHEAECLESDAEQVRKDYLRQHGWTYTSSTPGCIWQWLKVWRGVQWNYATTVGAMGAESWIQQMSDGEESA